MHLDVNGIKTTQISRQSLVFTGLSEGLWTSSENEMVHLTGAELNQFFETLAQWEALLQAENQIPLDGSVPSFTSEKEVE